MVSLPVVETTTTQKALPNGFKGFSPQQERENSLRKRGTSALKEVRPFGFPFRLIFLPQEKLPCGKREKSLRDQHLQRSPSQQHFFSVKET